MLILDTLPLIDFFKGQSDAIKQIILDSEGSKDTVLISVVSLSELFYILAYDRGADFAKVCVEDTKTYIEAVHVNSTIAEKAGELKFHYAGKGKKGLPMADAIIAATALENDATLVTRDEHFRKIKGLKIRWV